MHATIADGWPVVDFPGSGCLYSPLMCSPFGHVNEWYPSVRVVVTLIGRNILKSLISHRQLLLHL